MKGKNYSTEFYRRFS